VNLVRLRLGGLDAAGLEQLRRFGEVSAEEDWYVIRGMSRDDVPALVDELVRLGARIYAVEPSQQTLEDRFLQLLGGTPDAGADHSASHPA
jgi:hypothetical protein